MSKYEIDLDKKHDISQIENLSQITELTLINYKMEVVFKNKEEHFDGNLLLTGLEKKKVYRNLKKLHLKAWAVNISGDGEEFEKTIIRDIKGRYFANVFHQLNAYFPNIEELIIENFRARVSVASLYLFKKVKTVEIVRNHTELDLEFLDKKNSIKLLKLTDSKSTYNLEDTFKLKKIFNVELRPKLSKSGETKLKDMEDSEVRVKQLHVKYRKEDIKKAKKILSNSKSISLEFTYEGKSLNGVPHTLKEFGSKTFIYPKLFYDLHELHKTKPFFDDYDLDFLKCIKGDDALAFFYDKGTRLIENGQYLNGKLHGNAEIYFGDIPNDEADYIFYCNFENGLPHGYALFRGISDMNNDLMVVIYFIKGRINTIEEVIVEWDELVKWNNRFQDYDKALWKLLKKHLGH